MPKLDGFARDPLCIGGVQMRAELKHALKAMGLFDHARFARHLIADHLPSARSQNERMRDFYRGFVEPGDMCLDIGANLGNRSRVFLQLGANVVAVEPQRYCARVLRAKFGRNHRFTLIENALGSSPGQAEMSLGDTHTIATLSKDWRDRTIASGRWQPGEWTRTVKVEVTTLDRIIRHHGMPRFCKIDVEGFELEVLAGLSSPLESLSFEFTVPEENDKALACIDRLESLGRYSYNYSLAESMTLASREWVSAAEFRKIFAEMRQEGTWGDAYARLDSSLRPKHAWMTMADARGQSEGMRDS
jgi:FkbM family methyltransferase